MRHSTADNRLIGIVGIAFGLFCFSPFLILEKSKLIWPESDIFLIKYFLYIVLINAGLGFVLFGTLIFIGALAPFYSIKKSKYEKTKHSLIGIVLSLPFWIATSAVIFLMSEKMLIKVVWSLILTYLLITLFSNINYLKTEIKSSSHNPK